MNILIASLAFSLMRFVDCQACGRTPIPPVESRIVGGEVAKPYSWPWQVAFCMSEFWSCNLFCGASLISNQWVMTAGHCVYGQTGLPDRFKLKMGVYDEENDYENGEVVMGIDKIILHPQYDHATTSNDIALLHLTKPVKFSDHIQPVCIPKSDDGMIDAGSHVIITGWGDTSYGGDISPQLRQARVPVVGFDACTADYKGNIKPDVMFCAGQDGKDSCQGDSGGPVVVEKPGKPSRWMQYGIVSWGYGCAQKGFPGIYTRVSAFAAWIQQETSIEAV